MNIAQTTQETLGLMKESLAKNVTLSTGLTAYDLQAPAKNLYPTITPLRNSLPRVARLNPGDAARWRTISSVTGSGYDAMGWVPEGQRSASMSYRPRPTRAPVPHARRRRHSDLRSGSRGAGLRRRQRHRDLAPSAEDDAQGGDGAARRQRLACASARRRADPRRFGHGATLPAATYSVIVVGLTLRRLGNSRLAGGFATTKTITGNDGNTYTLNGGSSIGRERHPGGDARPGPVRDRPAGQRRGRLRLVRRRRGLGDAAGDHDRQQRRLQRAARSGHQAANAITADNSRNPTLAFDGLLTVGFNPVNSAYVQALYGHHGDRHSPDRFRPRIDRRDRHCCCRCGTIIACRPR